MILYEDTNHMNDRINIDPAICHGKPVIRGTRVPVSIVLGSLAIVRPQRVRFRPKLDQ